jgi:hypothetical protein
VNSDVYGYWRALCRRDPAPPEPLPTIGATIPGENPQAGLWRVRPAKGAPEVLCQIWLADAGGQPASEWRDGLTLAGTIDGKLADADRLARSWLFVKQATKDEAAFWRANGRWPADPEPLPPPRSDNAPADPFEALKLDAAARIEQAEARLKEPIADQLGCDKARNLQAELLAIEKRADDMFEREKAPIRERGREVDRKYDFRAAVARAAADLRAAFGRWMADEEARQQAERDRAYREQLAAQQAEQARLDAERAKKLADEPVLALTDPPPEPVPPPPPPAPVKVQAGGGVGRKSGLKDDWHVSVTDYKLAALFVLEDPRVCVLVGKIIYERVKAARGAVDIPGVTITKTRKAN